jgi:hypothetical protein
MARVALLLTGLKSVSLVRLNRRLRRRFIKNALIKAAIRSRRAAITIPTIAPVDMPLLLGEGDRVGETIVPLLVVEEVVVMMGSELVVVMGEYVVVVDRVRVVRVLEGVVVGGNGSVVVVVVVVGGEYVVVVVVGGI